MLKLWLYNWLSPSICIHTLCVSAEFGQQKCIQLKSSVGFPPSHWLTPVSLTLILSFLLVFSVSLHVREVLTSVLRNLQPENTSLHFLRPLTVDVVCSVKLQHAILISVEWLENNTHWICCSQCIFFVMLPIVRWEDQHQGFYWVHTFMSPSWCTAFTLVDRCAISKSTF